MNENKSYPVEEWRTDWQIELVQDVSRNWTREKFKSVAGFWIIRDGNRILGKTSQHAELPPDAVLDHTVWDHEHCGLCWQTISERNHDQQEGFTDGKEWVCVACYDKYLALRRK